MKFDKYASVLTVTLLFIFMAGMLCSCTDAARTFVGRHSGIPATAPWVTKEGVLSGPVVMESTPVIWNNKVALVTWDHGSVDPSIQDLVVYDMATMTQLSRVSTGLGFISALVDNGTLYVFGTVMSGERGYQVNVLSTSDMVTWTHQTILFSASAGQTIYNTSVAPDKDGGFIMAYEVCEAGSDVCFHVRFKHSDDLTTWSDVGGLMQGPPGRDYYTGCPTIRYVNGFWYLFSLADYGGSYATIISRSSDLFTWAEAGQNVVAPDGPDKNKNASDFDLVEFNGQVQMVYTKSYQEAGSNVDGIGIRRAVFSGSLQDFVERFF